jgi:hypothetical protein
MVVADMCMYQIDLMTCVRCCTAIVTVMQQHYNANGGLVVTQPHTQPGLVHIEAHRTGTVLLYISDLE